ncbi:methyltransferase domain-containing protein [Nonomuraea sp. NPDC049421]|uniref:class I SAM-dependent methyltransferase n=1 Tax=Nonomuraea sp. NPDC049421 TaxID=3155275 RepID=UPI0034263D4E
MHAPARRCAAHQRAHEPFLLADVLEHRAAEGEQLSRLAPRRGVQEGEVVEVAEQHALLVGEVGVERGPAHVGALDDVGDGHRVVALLQDQRHQRLLDQPSCAPHPPVSDSSFDLVVSSLAIHHIPSEARPEALRQMFRVLRPGGRLLIAEFRPPDGHLTRHLVGLLSGPAMQHDPRHLLGTMIPDAGFQIEAEGRLPHLMYYIRATRPQQDNAGAPGMVARA